MSPKSTPAPAPATPPGRVVRHRLADGTVKEYRYPPHRPRRAEPPAPDSVAALIAAFTHSPEWTSLAPATRETYQVYLRVLAPLGAAPAASIRRRDLLLLRDAIAAERGRGAASGFVRTASRLFGWAVARDWLENSPASRVPPLPGGHLPAWTEDDVARALSGLPEPLRRVVVLALHTGQRRGDLVSLPWSAFDGTSIRLRQQKTGVALVIPVTSALRAELDAWRRSATSTLILTTGAGTPWHPNRLSQQMSWHLRRLGMPALNVHGIRKLAATRLADAGCSVHEIAAVTGHRTLGMVQLYTASADQARLADAAVVRLERAARRRTKFVGRLTNIGVSD